MYTMALDRDTVLRAGLRIVDADGIDALSMRRLAADLRVTPMALYNHVAGRADLLDGLADAVAREIAPPHPRWGWRRRLRTVALGIRAACVRHPAAAALLQQTRAATPALLAPTEAALAALEEGGLAPRAARVAWSALIGLTFGHVGYQLAGHMTGPASATGTVDAAAFPRIAAMGDAAPFDWDRAFDRALDALIDGLIGSPAAARARAAPAIAATSA
jgi:TetR/AcrR family transcriptional regulator, tetracycline repressor protein